MKRSILIAGMVIALVIVIWAIYSLFTNFAGIQNVQGVKIQTETKGSGEAAKAGDTVTVNYIGTLQSGQQFDSSYDRNQPISFILGQDKVIKGFDIGVTGMKVGEKRKITIPSDLGYGSIEFAGIPANSVLIYEVELLSINQ